MPGQKNDDSLTKSNPTNIHALIRDMRAAIISKRQDANDVSLKDQALMLLLNMDIGSSLCVVILECFNLADL